MISPSIVIFYAYVKVITSKINPGNQYFQWFPGYIGIMFRDFRMKGSRRHEESNVPDAGFRVIPEPVGHSGRPRALPGLPLNQAELLVDQRVAGRTFLQDRKDITHLRGPSLKHQKISGIGLEYLK